MQLKNEQVLPCSQARAWEALNDTAVLAACIPGCESIQMTEPNRFDLAMTAAIGPVKARFAGRMSLENVVVPESYTIRFEGQGGVAGHGRGSADVRLESQGDNETLLHYTVDAQVGGKIAQVGSRLVDMAAAKLARDFFGALTAHLAT